jgi:outer membrane protein OmpA-like peptidoglycan-associated protein
MTPGTHAIGEERSPLSLGLEGGLAFPSTPADFSKDYDSGGAYGGRIRYDLRPSWSLAGTFSSHRFKEKKGDKIVFFQPLTLSSYSTFIRWGPWRCHGAVHLGVNRHKQDVETKEETGTSLTYGLGIGMEINLTDLTSAGIDYRLNQFPGGVFSGKPARDTSVIFLVNFYIPQSWAPSQFEGPLKFREIEIAPTPQIADNIKQAQEELDQVQQDIRDRKIPPIHFETDQVVLLPASFEPLDIVGTILRRHLDLSIRIDGHADEVGTEDYNKVLSQDRANVVRTYLIENFSLSADKLSTAAFGKTQPAAPNDTEEGRFLNRRVEFKIIP